MPVRRSGLEWAVHAVFRSGQVRIEGYPDANTAHRVCRDWCREGVRASVVACPVLRGDYEWIGDPDARD